MMNYERKLTFCHKFLKIIMSLIVFVMILVYIARSGPVVVDSLFIVAPIVAVLCLLHVLCALSSYCNHLDGKRELITLLCLSSWCLVTDIGLWFFLTETCLSVVRDCVIS